MTRDDLGGQQRREFPRIAAVLCISDPFGDAGRHGESVILWETCWGCDVENRQDRKSRGSEPTGSKKPGALITHTQVQINFQRTQHFSLTRTIASRSHTGRALQWRLRRRNGQTMSHCLRLDLIIVIPVGMKAVPGVYPLRIDQYPGVWTHDLKQGRTT